MEGHRLQPMPENYDQELFLRLYKATIPIRKKLAATIDSTRFGVEYKDVLSWFDEKFIFAFTRYYGKYDEEVLKGHIITALDRYKYRIMKMAYSNKFNQHNFVKVEDTSVFEGIVGVSVQEDNLFRRAVLNYMREALTNEAFLVLQTELYPPPYLLDKMTAENIKSAYKIKPRQVIDYLGWEDTEKTIRKYRKYKQEIKQATAAAREFFENHPEQVEYYAA